MVKDILLFLDDTKTNVQRIQLGLSLTKQLRTGLTAAAFGSMTPIHAPKTQGEQAISRMSERMAEKIINDFNLAIRDNEANTDTLVIYGDAVSSAT